MKTITHKTSGWTRTAIGFGQWTIHPTDDSGDRIVAFMSAHSWQNLPNDRRENIGTDRVVLVSGAELPALGDRMADSRERAIVRRRPFGLARGHR